MKDTEYGCYISRIVFNDGTGIDVKENDIIVFAGPNNAGKSQSLRDIYDLCEKNTPTIVVKEAQLAKEKDINKILSQIEDCREEGDIKKYYKLGHEYRYNKRSSDTLWAKKGYGDLRSLFVANLDTAARLNICKAPKSVERDGHYTHPIHYAAYHPEYRKWLSDSFKKAFGECLTPDRLNGATLPLRIGEPIAIPEQHCKDKNGEKYIEHYSEQISLYKKIEDQGDGIRSFTGILLYLMMKDYCTYLIDEPESFLHPPQARIMGKIIGETLSDKQQAFIATHSEDIIKGLMDTCPDRIKIVRIVRDEDNNSISKLDNDRLLEIWKDPLLRYSNIMSGLFHKSVALCESDSDCKFYSAVLEYMREREGSYSETLFIHCSGKHRMAKIAAALKAFDVDVKLIADIDVLDNESILRGIIEAFGGNWEEFKSHYKVFTSNLHSPKERVRRTDFIKVANEVEAASGEFLSEADIKKLADCIKTKSKWAALKVAGTYAIPGGEATVAFKQIQSLLEKLGIYIVPVGELECFVKDVGSHGPEWVNRVFEKYPDFEDEAYKTVKEFLSSVFAISDDMPEK